MMELFLKISGVLVVSIAAFFAVLYISIEFLLPLLSRHF
jgi:preprotein translocase subunit Sec61beta